MLPFILALILGLLTAGLTPDGKTSDITHKSSTIGDPKPQVPTCPNSKPGCAPGP